MRSLKNADQKQIEQTKMLKSIRIYWGIFAMAVVFMGCSASGATVNLSGSPETAREKDGDFIELENGDIVDGKVDKAVLSYSLYRGVTLEGKKYKYEDIIAVQKDNHYSRRFNKKNFGERIVKGKISVYKQMRLYAGRDGFAAEHAVYYLQKGDKTKIEYWDLNTLKAMVADNPAATAAYSEYKNLSGKEKIKHGASDLDNVISIYNQ